MAPSSAAAKSRRTCSIPFQERADLPNTPPLSAYIFELMVNKKSNLCLSADVRSTAELLQVAEECGDSICILKTHADIVSDFGERTIKRLVDIASRKNFLIFEDRKFGDIGSTVQAQYSGGPHRIADWAYITNAHIFPGPDIITSLKAAANANQSIPLYLSEMAPPKLRGGLNMCFQLFITIGILAANCINYGTQKIAGWGWRVSLALAAVPALIITIGSLFLADTPNSLIERGHRDKALVMLEKIRGTSNVQEEFDDMILASEESKKVKHPFRNILQRKYRPHLVMAIAIPFFQQLTGINVIMFYAPVLFKTIGFGSNASLLSAVITGTVNAVATLVSIFTVDKVGRRFLFMEGGVQMFVSQVVIAIILGIKFGANGEGSLSKGYATFVVVLICIYVSAFAWSWGPLGWLVPSEIFPLEIRSAGQSINVSVNLLFTFAIAQAFLAMLCHMKFGLFLFFAGFVLIMSIFIYVFLPETKNIPIEEMYLVWQRHWFWKNYVEHDDKAQDMELAKGDSK